MHQGETDHLNQLGLLWWKMRAWQWQSTQTLVITHDLTSTLNAWLGSKAYFPKSAGCLQRSYLWVSQSRLWQRFHTQLVEINLTPLFNLTPTAGSFWALLSGCWPPHILLWLLKKIIKCSVTSRVVGPAPSALGISSPGGTGFFQDISRCPSLGLG